MPYKLSISKTPFVLIFIVSLIFFQACSFVNKIAGADIDPEQFAKAREAKMYEVRAGETNKSLNRLLKKGPPDEADFIFYLSDSLLNKLAAQYVNAGGWLDETTNFTVKEAMVKLSHGSAIVTLKLLAHRKNYNVDVSLDLDCIMAFGIENNELKARIEPFNIVPDVDAPGILSVSEDLISNLIKINLADLGKNFKSVKIPLEFGGSFELEEKSLEIRDKINLNIRIPAKIINYSLKLKEILIFKNKVLVALNIGEINVR